MNFNKLREFASKKGQNTLQQAPAAVIILVVIAVVIGVGATVLDKVQDTQTADTVAFNATSSGLTGLGDFADFQPTMAIIVVAVIIIGLLLSGFALAGRARR